MLASALVERPYANAAGNRLWMIYVGGDDHGAFSNTLRDKLRIHPFDFRYPLHLRGEIFALFRDFSSVMALPHKKVKPGAMLE